MRTMFAIIALVAAGLSLGGCQTDKEYAQSTHKERLDDCNRSKGAGMVTGLPGGLVGVGVGYMLMSGNRSCKG